MLLLLTRPFLGQRMMVIARASSHFATLISSSQMVSLVLYQAEQDQARVSCWLPFSAKLSYCLAESQHRKLQHSKNVTMKKQTRPIGFYQVRKLMLASSHGLRMPHSRKTFCSAYLLTSN